MNECKEMLLEIRDHDSNPHQHSLIPRTGRDDSRGEWLDCLEADVKYKRWLNLMGYIDYLKKERPNFTFCSYSSSHLHKYKNGGLVLIITPFTKNSLKNGKPRLQSK